MMAALDIQAAFCFATAYRVTRIPFPLPGYFCSRFPVLTFLDLHPAQFPFEIRVQLLILAFCLSMLPAQATSLHK